ncbi:MAG: ATP-binding protein [Actinobacteria bacterium]|nr:ATP-binding protein [Actinomycetota bacterium]
MSSRYPFSAVVGQDDLKLALLLAALDPGIGGVLLRGQKGSAKTTVARGLAALLPGVAPFAELPLGATEDRVVGTLDLRAVLAGEGSRFEPGLLAAADGGVLYVDEVNLLADHLVDVLLDVAVSGVNRVEREGVSHQHPARFVLIGSMNPEEGELRPQLLDRFGLAVEVVASQSPAERAEVIRRRLAFDADPAAFSAAWGDTERLLAERLASARPAEVPDELLEPIAALCVAVGAEGLRADLVLARGAAALAGWDGRLVATVEDVRRVAPLALAHRRRRTPFEAPGMAGDELDRALDDALGAPDEGHEGDGGGAEREHPMAKPVAPIPLAAVASTQGPSGRRSIVPGTRGRLVGDRPTDGPVASVAVTATVRATATARAEDRSSSPVVREAIRDDRCGNLVILAVDTSGSMGVERRMAAVTGAVTGLLVDAYQRRDRVAIVGFRGDGAEVVVRPTGSVEVARARLSTVTTGGRTPLAAGIDVALELAISSVDGRDPLLVVVSDGRATAGPVGQDPVEAALAAAERVRRRGVTAVVVDAEEGPTRLGLTRQLAQAMGARHLTLDELAPKALGRS